VKAGLEPAVGARVRPAVGAGLCFAGTRYLDGGEPGAAPAPTDAHALDAATGQALADVLPFLLCGEESAVHAFGRRLAGHVGRAAALAGIADDEARHAAWLEVLSAALPAPTRTPDVVQMTGFFRRLLTRDAARHFAQIAALDLAVCEILRPLVAPGGALTAAPSVIDGLRAIRQDEARHVRVARDCARELGLEAAQQRALETSVRESLAQLLAPVQSSLRRLGFAGFGRMIRGAVARPVAHA